MITLNWEFAVMVIVTVLAANLSFWYFWYVTRKECNDQIVKNNTLRKQLAESEDHRMFTMRQLGTALTERDELKRLLIEIGEDEGLFKSEDRSRLQADGISVQSDWSSHLSVRRLAKQRHAKRLTIQKSGRRKQ